MKSSSLVDGDFNYTAPNSPIPLSGSMSARRLAANIPVLHRRLSLSAYRDPRTTLASHTPIFSFAPFLQCSTPLTPANQVLHTPLSPPDLLRRDRKEMLEKRKTTSLEWPRSPTSPDAIQSSPSPTPCTPDALHCGPAQNLMRRLSIATSPDARSLNLPRRLSYSHISNASSSPLTIRPDSSPFSARSVQPFNGALASPLYIRSARWTPLPTRQYFDFRTPSAGSPIGVKGH